MPPLVITTAILVGLIGVSHGASQQAAPASVQQIEAMIETYGKRAIIRFILKQTSGQITLHVDNEFRTFYGIPDPVYVTPHTIRIDSNALGGVTDGDLKRLLQKSRKDTQR